MYKITKEQVQTIINAFYDLNSPVKLFEGVQKLLQNLPECTQTETKEEVSNDKNEM